MRVCECVSLCERVNTIFKIMYTHIMNILMAYRPKKQCLRACIHATAIFIILDSGWK